VEKGDFSRSENHGLLMLAGLAKMRAEVADDGGVAKWIGVLVRHAKLKVPLSKLPELGALARRLDPARLKNVVAPGRIGMTSGQSVVFLTSEAAKIFQDLRDDAVVGTAAEETTTTSSTAPTRSPSSARSSPSSSTSTSTTSAEESTDESTTSTTDNSDTPVTLFPDE
jgi:hypothetical protein